MKNFCLITNVNKDPGLFLSDQIRDFIIFRGGKCHQLMTRSDPDEAHNVHMEDVPEGTEIILVLGGDGTLIRAATRVESLHIPVIGVNLGTLGYLCELDRKNLFDALQQLLLDHYMVEDRIMLTGMRDGQEERYGALNDIVIHHGGDIRLLLLNVYVNGEFLYNYHADGIIISTPTGSTGYNMSAGGPIVDPKANVILLTPNNAHNLSSKSIVLSGDDEITIEVCSSNSTRNCNIYVSADGDRICQLMPGESFRVRRSDNRVKICKLNNRSFLEILSKKMKPYD